MTEVWNLACKSTWNEDDAHLFLCQLFIGFMISVKKSWLHATRCVLQGNWWQWEAILTACHALWVIEQAHVKCHWGPQWWSVILLVYSIYSGYVWVGCNMVSINQVAQHSVWFVPRYLCVCHVLCRLGISCFFIICCVWLYCLCCLSGVIKNNNITRYPSQLSLAIPCD